MEIKEATPEKQDSVGIKLEAAIPTETNLIEKNVKECVAEIYSILDKVKSDIRDLRDRCDNLKFLLDRR